METHLTQVGPTVDLFYSASLADQFPANSDTWINGEPGQIIIGYGGYNPANGIYEVTRIVMGLRNNS